MAVGFHWGMIRTEALHQALQVANASHLWEMQLVQTVASRSMFGGEHSHQHYHPVFQLTSARIYSAISQVFGGTPSLCWKDTWRSSATHSSSKGGLGSDGVFLVGVQGTSLLSGLDVLVLEKQKYQQLDGFILRTGRKLLQGRACTVMAAYGIQHVPRKQFGRCWDCAHLSLSSECEDYGGQQLASNISKHICILLALFGRLGCG